MNPVAALMNRLIASKEIVVFPTDPGVLVA